MAWFWTDDLARALVDEGLVSDDAVQEWIRRPVALAGAGDVDPVAMGCNLLGIDLAEEGAA